MSTHVIGIDIGTSRIKAALLDRDGRTGSTHSVPTPWQHRGADIDMSPVALLDAVGELLSRFTEQERHGIAGVGIASMGETGTFIRGKSTPDTPMIGWHDGRGAETVDVLHAAFPDGLARATGRPARLVSTVAKLGWMRQSGWDMSGTWVGIAGLVAWRLSNGLAQETSLAATSGVFDPYLGRYEPPALAAAGLDHVTFATVLGALTPVGQIDAAGAAWSGIPPGTSVHIAGHDHIVGALGAGAQTGDLVDSAGSGEALLAVLHGDPAQRSRDLGAERLTVTRWPADDRLVIVWEELLPGLAMAQVAEALDLSRDLLETLALAHTSESSADRDWLRAWESSTPERPAIPWPDDPGRTWAWVLEGYAAAAAEIEARVRAISGSNSHTTLIGGGQRSRRWMAAKARRARFGIDVVNVEESVARGAGVIAAAGLGWWTVASAPYPARQPMALPPVFAESPEAGG